jgi:hypothetical protein
MSHWGRESLGTYQIDSFAATKSYRILSRQTETRSQCGFLFGVIGIHTFLNIKFKNVATKPFKVD